MKCKKLVSRIVTVLLLSLFFSEGEHIVFASGAKAWPDSPAVNAKQALVMDIATGTVLVESNSTEKAYPASVTKIMTALIAIEQAKSLDEKVTFTKEAVRVEDRESSSIGMMAGEELTLGECLHALLLASANEVANAIAIHIAGSREAFVELMNRKAQELGCVNTHFNNPTGLYDPEHYTCALDMAKIGREAVKHEDFRKIAGTRSYIIPKTALMKVERPIAHYHQMINPAKFPQYAYEHCYAGKTGYTKESELTLVSFAKKGTMDLVCVVLGAKTRDGQYGSTSKLFNYCFKRFRMEQAKRVRINFGEDPVYKAIMEKNGEAVFSVQDTAMLLVPKRCDVGKIETSVTFFDQNEVEAGENTVGSVGFRYMGKDVGKTDLILNSETSFVLKEGESEEGEIPLSERKEETRRTKKGKAFYKILLAVGLVAMFLALVSLLFYRLRERKRKRRSGYFMHRRLKGSINKKNRLKW